MAAIRIVSNFVTPTTPGINVFDEGVAVVTTQDVNFTGAGVTVTENPVGTAEVDIPGFTMDVEDEGVPVVVDPLAINFTGAGVTVTENPVGTAEVNIPGVQLWTESESAATEQNTRWTPNNAAANVSAVIQPKGAGSNLSQRPDGTATGGNARGTLSTDFQKERASSNQVASGTRSFIGAGRNNRASGNQSSVVAGSTCVASGEGSQAGGLNSTASGENARAQGASCVASGNNSSCYGDSSTASGLNSHVRGNICTASTSYSAAEGRAAVTQYYGEKTEANGFFSGGAGTLPGSCQHGRVIAFRNTTYLTGAANNLSFDGTGVTNLFNHPSANCTLAIKAQCVASVVAITGTATGINVGDYIATEINFSAKKVASALTVSAATILSTSGDAAITGTATFTFTAGGSGEIIVTFTAPTFAGGGTLSMRAAVTFYITEIITTA